MPRVRTVQASFTRGELDPRLAARVDAQIYYAGAEAARNVLVLPMGGFRTRPGWVYVGAVGDAGAGHVMVPFSFNTEQDYLLIFTGNTIRIYREGVVVATLTGTPWGASQVEGLGFAQSADTLIICDHDVAPYKLVRGGSHSSWTLSALTLKNLPGYDYGAIVPAGTMTPAAKTGQNILVTHSTGVFTADHVGWYIRGNSGLARIITYTSATQVQVDILIDFRNTSAIAAEDWVMEEPIISATRGWPSRVIFHQGRLYFANLKNRPATIIGSKSGEFFDFDPGGALDDEGIDATIDDDEVNAIYQLVSGRHLTLLTSGSEHVALVQPPITPTNIALEEQTRWGIKANVRPVQLDGALLFVQRGGRAVREFLFTNLENAYQANQLSLLSPHLVRDPVSFVVRKGTSFDEADYLLLVNDDGTVATVNLLRAQEINAFTLFETDGEVQDAAVVGEDVYFLVRRSIGGATVYYVEKWDEDAHLDASCRFTAGMPLSVVTGLGHLEGESVAVLVDGEPHPARTVSGGQITLERAAQTSVEVGLDPAWRVKTMPVEGRLPDGTMITKQARVVKASLRLHQTRAIRLNGFDLSFRRVGDPLDAAPIVFTGDHDVDGLQGWDSRAQAEMDGSISMPATVLGVALRVAV